MGGLISSGTIEQVRAASDIVEVIGGYVPLKRNGTNFVGLCPFHKEKSPSFNVTPHKQFFHCFGCHKGGNVFQFIQEYENIGFVDAVRRLAERAHIVIEMDNNPGQQEARHIKDRLLTVHEQITQRWQTALINDGGGQIARDYLLKRGVSEDAVKLFRIGYAPDAWDDTVNWAKSKDFDLVLLEQSGLIVKKEGSDHYYDRFRGRLMFPICDDQGRVIGFSGRILSGDEKTAKYVNSQETPIFSKGKVLFGLDKSKNGARDTRTMVVCEGQLDMIACFMAGIKNIVAPQGTAFTTDHARILKRHVDEVVLCFDSDNAGQNATVKALDGLLASGLAVRVATVPPPHDPDSYIKANGGSAFADLIKSARGFFDYYLDRLCATNDLTTDRGRIAVVESMTEAVRKTGSDVLLDTYAQKTALRLSVGVEATRKEFRKQKRETFTEAAPEEETVAPLPRPPLQECWLLRLLLETDEFVEWIGAHLELDWVTHATVRDIVEMRLEAFASESWRGVAAWLSESEDPGRQSLVTEILADSRPMTDSLLILQGSPTKDGLLKILRDKWIERQLAMLSQRTVHPETPEAEQHELILQAMRLRSMKKLPLSPKGDS